MTLPSPRLRRASPPGMEAENGTTKRNNTATMGNADESLRNGGPADVQSYRGGNPAASFLAGCGNAGTTIE